MIDKYNMFSAISSFPKQIEESRKLGKKVKILEEIDYIIVAGMGASAITGDILKSYLEHLNINIPVFTVRSNKMPCFVTKKTVVFVVSYSGNTEETIEAYKDARKRHCNIITISTGGKLQELCEFNKTDFVKIPKSVQPRTALASLFFPMLNILESSFVVSEQDYIVSKMIKSFEKNLFEQTAKTLVSRLKGKIPIIYASPSMAAVAERWKTQFNENSKIHAFFNVFSEFNHNEIVGFTKLNGDYYVILLRDEDDNFKMQKRIKATKEVIKKSGVNISELLIKGENYLTRIFSAINIGDWTSFYLALEYGIDPGPVDAIEELKDRIK